jgi:hypothetical protein
MPSCTASSARKDGDMDAIDTKGRSMPAFAACCLVGESLVISSGLYC